MSKQQWKGGALLAPVPPVLVTSGDIHNTAVLTVGWTGIINTQPPMTYISIRPTRHSYKFIAEGGEFVINLPTAKMAKQVDYCGCTSGSSVNKLEKCGFTLQQGVNVKVPTIDQCRLSLECKVKSMSELGSHHMFIADIVGVNVDEEFLEPNGRLMVEKLDLLCYAHGTYFALGQALGRFGYSVKKPEKKSGKYKRRK